MTEWIGDRVKERSDFARSKNILLVLLFGRRALHQGLCEPMQGIQRFVGQVLHRYLSVHNVQRTFRIACELEFVAISTWGQFRHEPLADPRADLTVSRVKLAVISDRHNFVAPILQQHLACGAVTVGEALYIADGPATHRAFAGHARVATDGAQAFAFGHSGSDGVGYFTGVIRLRHSSSFSHARYCESIPRFRFELNRPQK